MLAKKVTKKSLENQNLFNSISEELKILRLKGEVYEKQSKEKSSFALKRRRESWII